MDVELRIVVASEGMDGRCDEKGSSILAHLHT